jgi:hypothetical protein
MLLRPWYRCSRVCIRSGVLVSAAIECAGAAPAGPQPGGFSAFSLQPGGLEQSFDPPRDASLILSCLWMNWYVEPLG